MKDFFTLFFATFATMLAVVNPLEVLPVFLKLLQGQDEKAHRKVAFRSCLYALILIFFFLVFGTFLLKVFGVNLSMIRVVGGIILMRIGFNLFIPSASDTMLNPSPTGSGSALKDYSFVPLAMPLMFGPGVLATVISMTSTVKHPEHQFAMIGAIALACLITMIVIFLILFFAKKITTHIGANGIDAASRIVGFFVAAMGMGLIFHGLVDFFQTNHLF